MYSVKKSQWKRDRQKRRKKRLAALLLTVFIIFGASMIFSSGGAADVPDYTKIMVQPNDTLWKIARNHLPAGMDIREFIFVIKKVNNVQNSIIHPGDILLLPI